jgi:D-alanyl-D-alanine carboxypeptidase
MSFKKLSQEYLMYFAMLCFFFIASFSLSLGKAETEVSVKDYKSNFKLSSIPILKGTNNVPIISAQGVLAVDLNSGMVLFEKNPDLMLLPASTTKIMTALIAMDYYPTDLELSVGNIRVQGQRMRLLAGEKITAGNLIEALLIFSANDAAEALAENYPGGREEFIAEMNRKAGDLRLVNTKFKNPSGLEEEGHVSTAKDMVRLASYAMKRPEFARIVSTKEKTVASTDGKIIHRLKNINELLGVVDGVSGVKTGWTENARENLITYIERNNRRVLIAALGSQDRFGETKEIINWIFENYSWEAVAYSPPSP